jgi:hypothetical protein
MMGKPGRQCSICEHREHAAIDLAFARGVSAEAIAKRYGVGPDSVLRHAKAHIPAQLRAKLLAGPDLSIDLDKLKETESQSLLSHLVALRHRLFASFDQAEIVGDFNMTARVASQLHRNLELTGKLLGDLGIGSTTINNVLVMPSYIELRVALVQALAPYGEARQAVAAVLHKLEHKAAETIAADTRELAQ